MVFNPWGEGGKEGDNVCVYHHDSKERMPGTEYTLQYHYASQQHHMGRFSLSLSLLPILTGPLVFLPFKQNDNDFEKDWRRSALIRSFDLFVYYQTRPLSYLFFAIAMHMKMQKWRRRTRDTQNIITLSFLDPFSFRHCW